MSEIAPLPKVYRPLGARMVSAVASLVLVAVITFLWLMLPADVQADFGWFQRSTLVAFFAAVVVTLYGIFRTRVVASKRGISVRNGYRRHDLDWAEIVAVHLTSSRPWALADLSDGTTVALMALQTADGPRATRAARELAALVVNRSGTERDD